jgi:flagellar assembly protein FliH
VSKKTEKFLFNKNIFDEPDIEDDAPEEPPPPTFSEEELEQTRKTTYDLAYNQGLQDGIKQEKESRDQQIAAVLKDISSQIGILFSAEQQRESIYEQESLRLCLAVFEQLFPEISERYGHEELSLSIASILEKQQGQTEIQIETHPYILEGIQNHLKTLPVDSALLSRLAFKENPSLAPLECRILWKDGGAVHNPADMALHIQTILQQALAGNGANRHDSSVSSTPALDSSTHSEAALKADEDTEAQNNNDGESG